MKNQSVLFAPVRLNRRVRVLLWLCLSVLLAVCILLVLYKKLPRKTVVSNIRTYNHMALLTEWETVTQRFTAVRNGLDKVTVVYAWGKTADSHGATVITRFSTSGTMNYRLSDANGHTLASGRINRVQAIADNCYCPVSFAPIARSKGRSYTLTLTMDKKAQILGLFVTDKGAQGNSLIADGKPATAELVAEYNYEDSRLMTDVRAFLKGDNIFWSLIISIFAVCLLSLLACNYLLKPNAD